MYVHEIIIIMHVHAKSKCIHKPTIQFCDIKAAALDLTLPPFHIILQFKVVHVVYAWII